MISALRISISVGGWPFSRGLLVSLLACVLMFAPKTATAAPADEIEGLLRFVARLEGASLLRNGATHPPQAAEAHLRLKWNQQKAKIETAEDFIRLCATKSSVSGKPYSIRFKDGHEEPCATVLMSRLQLIRTTPAASANPERK